MDYKQYIANKLKIEGVSAEEIASFITATPSQDMGDYALPCFRFAKAMRKAPVVIAEQLASEFETDDGEWHMMEGKWDMIIAFPPCTYLTVTGNRWFDIERYGEKAIQRHEERYKASEFFMRFVNADCDRKGH